MKHPLRLLLIVALVVAGWWIWGALFPNPKTVIRKRLTELAHLASFSPKEGNITRYANVEKLGNLFAERIEFKFNIPYVELPSGTTRAELKSMVMAIYGSGRTVETEFIDIDPKILPDNESALVNLTVRAKISGESDLFIQELQLNMKKVEGDWLISRIQTVPTLR